MTSLEGKQFDKINNEQTHLVRTLPGTRIEKAISPPFLDAGGDLARRRRLFLGPAFLRDNLSHKYLDSVLTLLLNELEMPFVVVILTCNLRSIQRCLKRASQRSHYPLDLLFSLSVLTLYNPVVSSFSPSSDLDLGRTESGFPNFWTSFRCSTSPPPRSFSLHSAIIIHIQPSASSYCSSSKPYKLDPTFHLSDLVALGIDLVVEPSTKLGSLLLRTFSGSKPEVLYTPMALLILVLTSNGLAVSILTTKAFGVQKHKSIRKLLCWCIDLNLKLEPTYLKSTKLSPLDFVLKKSRQTSSCKGQERSKDSSSLSFVKSTLVAEALAVRSPLIQGKTLGISKLEVLMDSIQFLRAIKSISPPSDLFGVVSDFFSLGKNFIFVVFNFVPRTRNGLEVSLAKKALSGFVFPLTF